MDPVGLKLLQVAKTQLGYTEHSDGYTKFGDWYGKNVGHGSYYTNAPWCDMFLAWAAAKIGVQDWAGEFASTPDHANWFVHQHAWGQTPEPGAIVFFSWSGGKSIGDIEHVGLVESVDGSTLHTIEANHNNGLSRVSRSVSQVVGYGYPAKVQVKGKPVPGTAAAYAPRHSAPPPSAQTLVQPVEHTGTSTSSSAPSETPHQQLPDIQATMTGLLAVIVFGTVTLAIAKSKVRMPIPSTGVRVRKRGRHHRLPVELPAELSVADLDAADAGTAIMPALTEAAAAYAEDQEFWGRIAGLEEDAELAFWDSLHDAVSQPVLHRSPAGVGS
jgi:CHAP domain